MAQSGLCNQVHLIDLAKWQSKLLAKLQTACLV